MRKTTARKTANEEPGSFELEDLFSDEALRGQGLFRVVEHVARIVKDLETTSKALKQLKRYAKRQLAATDDDLLACEARIARDTAEKNRIVCEESIEILRSDFAPVFAAGKAAKEEVAVRGGR